jgi:plasmid stabilization system protein ParE
MHLRWTEAAAADLERVADYLFAHAPDRAPRLVRSIYAAPETLLSFPHRGRPGKKSGTRELVLSPLP